MKPVVDFALMSDPELNRQFSRCWDEPQNGGDPLEPPPPKILEDISAELLIELARQRPSLDRGQNPARKQAGPARPSPRQVRAGMRLLDPGRPR